jgi:mannose-6-phosphate isomerase-like protein (cupin superfamily)
MNGSIHGFFETGWIEPEGHTAGAMSKLLANPGHGGLQHLDFRISLYRPMAKVAAHSHGRAEHVYHVLSGHGEVVLDGKRSVVGPNDTIIIPAGTEHALENTGTSDLRFVVATAPPGEPDVAGFEAGGREEVSD